MEKANILCKNDKQIKREGKTFVSSCFIFIHAYVALKIIVNV